MRHATPQPDPELTTPFLPVNAEAYAEDNSSRAIAGDARDGVRDASLTGGRELWPVSWWQGRQPTEAHCSSGGQVLRWV
jgi:hypothetical protein